MTNEEKEAAQAEEFGVLVDFANMSVKGLLKDKTNTRERMANVIVSHSDTINTVLKQLAEAKQIEMAHIEAKSRFSDEKQRLTLREQELVRALGKANSTIANLTVELGCMAADRIKFGPNFPTVEDPQEHIRGLQPDFTVLAQGIDRHDKD